MPRAQRQEASGPGLSFPICQTGIIKCCLTEMLGEQTRQFKSQYFIKEKATCRFKLPLGPHSRLPNLSYLLVAGLASPVGSCLMCHSQARDSTGGLDCFRSENVY